jgi:hypothetical protein
MPTFVPIHRAFRHNWVRAETTAALEADGRQGRVIDLPSSETNTTEPGELQAGIAVVRRISDRIGTENVLVGPSRGGMVLIELTGTGQCSTAYA